MGLACRRRRLGLHCVTVNGVSQRPDVLHTNDVLKYLKCEMRKDESKIASTKGDVLLQASKTDIGQSSVQEQPSAA
jgi:hypothetical protein